MAINITRKPVGARFIAPLMRFIAPVLGITLLFACYTTFAKPVINIQHFTTKNGARVLFVQTQELPMLDIAVNFNAGSARDAGKQGIAQFTNAMLEEGTKTLDADQIAAQFDAVGAKFYASVNRDMAQVGLRTLTDKKFLQPALDTFAAVISDPKFTHSAFQRVQKQILSAIAEEQQQPFVVAKNAFYNELYGNAPYGHPVLGTTQSIQSLTPRDLKTFYASYYTAKNAAVSMVGDITLVQAKDIVNCIIEKLPQGQAAHSPSSRGTHNSSSRGLTAGSKTKSIKFPSAQTNIIIGQLGIAMNDPDYFPLLVGNYILGQSPLTSELFKEVRNKHGLTYSIGSAFAPLQSPGPFAIFLQTRTAKANEAIQISMQTLGKFIAVGPSAQQLQSAKQSIIGHFPLELASNEEIIGYLNVIGFYNLPLDYLDTYRMKISAVNLKQIKKVFQNHIDPRKMITIMVG